MRVCLYYNDNHRSLCTDSGYYSPIFDNIGDLLEKNGFEIIVLERPKPPRKKTPLVYRKGHRLPVLWYFTDKIVRNLIAPFTRKNKPSFSPVLFCFYFLLLKRLKADVIIGVYPQRHLCLAAHRTDTRVYDFQHGRTDGKNKYYTALDRLPSNQVPDGIFCWNEDSQQALSSVCKLVKSYVIGYPRQEKDIITGMLKHQASNKPTVLVCLGWGMTKNWDKKSIGLPDYVCALLRRKKSEFNVIVRAHPVSVKKFGKRVVEEVINRRFWPGIEIDFSDKFCIMTALSGSDVVISRGSAVSIQAKLIGVPSIFAVEYPSEGMDEESSCCVYSSNELLSRIELSRKEKEAEFNVNETMSLNILIDVLKDFP